MRPIAEGCWLNGSSTPIDVELTADGIWALRDEEGQFAGRGSIDTKPAVAGVLAGMTGSRTKSFPARPLMVSLPSRPPSAFGAGVSNQPVVADGSDNILDVEEPVNTLLVDDRSRRAQPVSHLATQVDEDRLE